MRLLYVSKSPTSAEFSTDFLGGHQKDEAGTNSFGRTRLDCLISVDSEDWIDADAILHLGRYRRVCNSPFTTIRSLQYGAHPETIMSFMGSTNGLQRNMGEACQPLLAEEIHFQLCIKAKNQRTHSYESLRIWKKARVLNVSTQSFFYNESTPHTE